MPPEAGNGISNMREARQRNKRSAPPPRHPRPDPATSTGDDAPPAVPAPEPAAEPVEKPPQVAAAAPEPPPAPSPPPEPAANTHGSSDAAKTVTDAALGWAAAMRKADARGERLAEAVRHARAAGVPEPIIAAALADAQQRSGGHAPPARAHT